jgi:hypothetical protein
MAIVKIKLSQGVVDQQRSMQGDALNPGSTPGGLIDFFVGALGSIEAYDQFTSWSLLGSTLVTTYADGAIGMYTGIVRDDPNALRGHASVSGYDFSKKDLLELGVTGKFHYDYDLSSGLNLTPSAQGMTINGLRLATLLPSTSPDYDPLLGNVAIVLNGAVTLLPNGEVRGSVQHLDFRADKFIRSLTMDGNFEALSTQFMGNPLNVFEGTLNSFNMSFADGSLIDARNAAATLLNSLTIEESLLRGTAGRDEYDIELPGTVYADMIVSTGDGDDLITLKGGGGRLKAVAGDGNDTIRLLGGAQAVEGGRGTDVVQLGGQQGDYVVKYRADLSNPDPRLPKVPVFSITDKNGVTSTVSNVERIVFDNATLAIDIDGNAGQAYRLYKAVLGRAPDAGGLGFWINSMDKGASLLEVAQAFMTTDEYKGLYGNSQSNLELVTRFYQNILGRDPDPIGRDFWVRNLDAKAAGVADVMAAISESAENKDGLAALVGNGFTYTPWTGG